MEIQTKTTIKLSTEELGNFKEFYDLLDMNESINLQDVWGILKAIAAEDNETLKKYEYYLDIIDN